MAVPTHTSEELLAQAALHGSIAQRASQGGLSRMALSRASGISYWKLSTGAPLDDDEIRALEAVLGELELAAR